MNAEASVTLPAASRTTRRRVATAHDAAWIRPALLTLLGLTAVLYLWDLGASGWANAYYSAAVQAGSKDWLAMLFGSFDASNAITVDKTPAALWVMDLSVRIFGFSSWSVLVPQALEGVAAVWLLFATVRRQFGAAAGLIAGAVLALTPIATLMFRFNNPDALLVLLLVASAYATTRAVEHASTRWLVLGGALIGFAFLAKMLQAFVVIPVFAGVYLLAAPTSLRRRLWQVGAAAVAVIVSAGWFVALVELWPAGSRPYIGGSQTNSIIDLMFGYNGFGRITGDEIGRVGGGGPFSQGNGILRLFGNELASQVSWLLPAALVAFVGLLWLTRHASRTSPMRAQVLLWGGWLLVTGGIFSLMEGIFHGYYTVALAPAIGALVGMGAVIGWRHRDDMRMRGVLAATIGGSAIWAAVILGRSPAFDPWLMPVVLGGGALVAVALVALEAGAARWASIAVGSASVILLLLAPGVASLATAAEAHTGAIPTAEPNAQAGGGQGVGFRGGPGTVGAIGPFGGGTPFGGFPFGGQFGNPFAGQGIRGPQGALGRGSIGGLLDAGQTNPELVAALRAGADGYRWVAATTGSNNAAGLALSSGETVMSIGGFNGTDPSPTLEQFQAYVAAGEIHYYVAGADAAGFRGAQGGSRDTSDIAAWVTERFTATTIGGVTVYDLTQ